MQDDTIPRKWRAAFPQRQASSAHSYMVLIYVWSQRSCWVQAGVRDRVIHSPAWMWLVPFSLPHVHRATASDLLFHRKSVPWMLTVLGSRKKLAQVVIALAKQRRRWRWREGPRQTRAFFIIPLSRNVSLTRSFIQHPRILWRDQTRVYTESPRSF